MSSTWISTQGHIWSWNVTPFHRFWGGGIWFDSLQQWVCAISFPVRLELNTLTLFRVSTNDLIWPSIGTMQLVLLYITICHEKFYKAHLVQFSSNVLDPHHSRIKLFLQNTYFPAVMEDHFKGNCWIHWMWGFKAQHVDLAQTDTQYQPTQRSWTADLCNMVYLQLTDVICGNL